MADIKACSTAVYLGSTANILCPFPPVDVPDGNMLMQEAFASGLPGSIIAACGSPTYPLQMAFTTSWTIGIGYAVVVWEFGAVARSTNTTPDI